ncbi:DUF4386 domain-containing protein [Paenibacillus sp. J5C_2022]|uniref:DUF4386 domain-containing protein n=1 Tax=Paenibacillus sp. J5C2022 TaxID=2977129 RepID=UPI0021D1C55B|nr:DUF4386 domain-containing protein [Paenibacillus sp. J5C2022]MCU6710489.1 DUF4386 domain-containing protein [Paenibacillus sp. J5C2022]
MKNLNNDQNISHKAAVIAGISLLIMTLAAFFAYGYVHSTLIVSEDAVMTLTNIQQSSSLFNLEILGWLIIIITDIIVSWSFYVFLKPVHREYALLAGWLRLVYTGMLAVAVSHLVVAQHIIRADNAMFGESTERLASQVMLSISSFESIWSFGLIIFGVHLLVSSFIALKARHIPKLVSILLLAAGVSYMVIHSLKNFLPELDGLIKLLEAGLSIPMIIGELGLVIWLLYWGRKAKTLSSPSGTK